MSDTVRDAARVMKKVIETTGRGHRLKSLEIIGGFLDGVKFDFCAGLNCIIGARGTGKTTVLELIRFALDAVPRDPVARKKFDNLVAGNLDGGRVKLVIETKDALTYTVSRSVGEPPIVVDAKRRPTTLNLNAIFRADVFSQNEVENIADQGRYQMDLIDSFQPDKIAELNAKIEEVSQQIGGVAKQIEPLQTRLSSLRESAKRLPEVESRLEQFAGAAGADGQEINEAHRLKAQRDRESRALGAIHKAMQQFVERVDALKGLVTAEISPLVTWEFLEGGNGGLFGRLDGQLKECGRVTDSALEKVTAEWESFAASLAQADEDLREAHNGQELAFRRLVEEQKQHQAQITERSTTERLRNQLLEEKREADDAEKKIAQLEKQSAALVSRLSELRDQRYAVRRQVADRLNAALKPTIRISIRQDGGAEEYQRLLEEALRGSGIRQNVVAQKITRTIPPEQLAALVRDGEHHTIIDRGDLNPDQASKLVEAFRGPVRLAQLLTAELRDNPRIELLDGGTYKDSAALSTGQKCTTILPILLLESENPLLIDQPEDNLDNRFIFETVVANLHRVKSTRQLIFVTHNPNIPVLGEASMVVVMDSDGAHARKSSEGSVDQCKAQIVTLLEGGEEAFRRRGERYCFQP